MSLIAGIEGKGGMAIGNVVGSNLANTLLILGAASLIQPISISPATKRIDIPYNILVTLVLFFMCFGFTFRHYPTGGVITWWKGILLLALFAGYMAYSFPDSSQRANGNGTGGRDRLPSGLVEIRPAHSVRHRGTCFRRTVVRRRRERHRIVARRQRNRHRHHDGGRRNLAARTRHGNRRSNQGQHTALGNVIGSNIFNICLILGISSIVAPLDVTGLHPTDILAPLAATLMLLLSVYTFRGQRINRADGALFLALYIGYIAYLLLR